MIIMIIIKKNIQKKNNINLDTPENINYKLISIDYNFNSLSKKKINKKRNEELVLPITNIFKTFQVNKYKNIINNISEDFPTKIVPIFRRTGYSLYNKKIDKRNNIKNLKKINIYNTMNNQNQSDINLGFPL